MNDKVGKGAAEEVGMGLGAKLGQGLGRAPGPGQGFEVGLGPGWGLGQEFWNGLKHGLGFAFGFSLLICGVGQDWGFGLQMTGFSLWPGGV